MIKPKKCVTRNGTIQYYLCGRFHRTDGPAVVYPNGAKSWYLNGKRHRADGPAIVWSNGSTSWYFQYKFFKGPKK